MFKKNYLMPLMVVFSILIVSCGDDESSSSFNLNINGLEDLGSTAVYEGWLIVEGSPVSTGIFTVDASGNLSDNNFDVEAADLENASTFVLTIEPSPDTDPGPSDIHILAGDFSGDTANLSIDHSAALGDGFAESSGKYILATPTDSDQTNEASGIWFLDNSSGSPVAGLELPILADGWVYEGWAVINGTPISTGVFTSPSGADNSALYSGPGGPAYPGEDFLFNAPTGFTFPVDLSNGNAVISIEPFPDNSPLPFTLKPLVSNIPSNAEVHSVIEMDQNLNFPSGSISR